MNIKIALFGLVNKQLHSGFFGLKNFFFIFETYDLNKHIIFNTIIDNKNAFVYHFLALCNYIYLVAFLVINLIYL